MTIKKIENGFELSVWSGSLASADTVWAFATLGEALDKVAELFASDTPVTTPTVELTDVSTDEANAADVE